MSQKEDIVNLLNSNRTMTQGALAEAIYGDKKHSPNTIASIPDVDERIENGAPEVVNIIARSNGKINLFSFASKYCCYHNSNLYGRDDFSILDTVLKEYLPKYFDDVTRRQIQKWQDGFNYKAYNDYITGKLEELGITIENRKRKFDHFVWYLNR